MPLEVIYDKNSRKVLGWQNITRKTHDWSLKDNERFIILDKLPEDPDCSKYLVDVSKGKLVLDPNYSDPEPLIDLLARIILLEKRVNTLEKAR